MPVAISRRGQQRRGNCWLDRSRRPEVAATIDALCSFESLELMRVRSGLSPSRTRRTLIAGVAALLDATN
mgnify:CR=1 FL=1